MEADFHRDVYVGFSAMAVGDPAKMLPDLGLTSTDDKPATAITFARVHAPMPMNDEPRSQVIVFVLNEELRQALTDSLIERGEQIAHGVADSIEGIPMIDFPPGVRIHE